MFQKLEALRLEGIARLAELNRTAGEAASQRLDALEDDPHYERVRARMAVHAERARPKLDAARDGWVEKRRQAGTSSAGEWVGSATRSVQSCVQTLPLLSGVGDVIAIRNGLDLLVPMLKAAPQDPQRNLWLGEALQRAERDMRAVAAARAMVNPWALATRFTVRFAAELGHDASDEPASVRFLRRAFQLATPAAKAGVSDAMGLHVLARVYLARGVPLNALRLAKYSVAVSVPEGGEALVTAARAYKVLGQQRNAARAARLAVQRGCTVGYEVLAAIAYAAGDEADTATTDGRLMTSTDLLARIDPAHRVRYSGVSRSRQEIAQVVAQHQRAKAAGTSRRAKELARDAAESLQVAAEQQLPRATAASATARQTARDAADSVRGAVQQQAAKLAATRGLPPAVRQDVDQADVERGPDG